MRIGAFLPQVGGHLGDEWQEKEKYGKRDTVRTAVHRLSLGQAKFMLRADGGAEALPGATKKEDGGEGGSHRGSLTNKAGTGPISQDGSGGDVGVEIKCFHNRLCQKANETSLGHTSGLATDEGKPEGTASCEGRWRSFCFPPFSADRRRHRTSL